MICVEKKIIVCNSTFRVTISVDNTVAGLQGCKKRKREISLGLFPTLLCRKSILKIPTFEKKWVFFRVFHEKWGFLLYKASKK